MGNRFERFVSFPLAQDLTLASGVLVIAGLPLCGSTQSLSVPDDLALRIRLDDTLTSVDSEVSDPFSATVVDKGDYQNARVYGHIAQIDTSGRIKRHTSMMLRFDRLVMSDGRRATIHAEIVELYHAPSGEKVDVEGAIESGGRGRKSIERTAIGAGAGALLGGIFGGGKGAGIGSIIGGAGDWEQRLFMVARRLLWLAAGNADPHHRTVSAACAERKPSLESTATSQNVFGVPRNRQCFFEGGGRIQ